MDCTTIVPVAVGQRAVRARARGVHRGGRGARGRLRARRRRHAVPRRGRRAAAGAAGRAAARRAGGHLQAGRQQPLAASAVPARVRDEPRPRGGLRRRRRSASDLFFRLAAARSSMPPLRERAEDILRSPSTSWRRGDGDAPALSEPVRDLLQARAYPGNVRDLKQLMARIGLRHVGPGPGDGRRRAAGRAPGRRPAPAGRTSSRSRSVARSRSASGCARSSTSRATPRSRRRSATPTAACATPPAGSASPTARCSCTASAGAAMTLSDPRATRPPQNGLPAVRVSLDHLGRRLGGVVVELLALAVGSRAAPRRPAAAPGAQSGRRCRPSSGPPGPRRSRHATCSIALRCDGELGALEGRHARAAVGHAIAQEPLDVVRESDCRSRRRGSARGPASRGSRTPASAPSRPSGRRTPAPPRRAAELALEALDRPRERRRLADRRRMLASQQPRAPRRRPATPRRGPRAAARRRRGRARPSPALRRRDAA